MNPNFECQFRNLGANKLDNFKKNDWTNTGRGKKALGAYKR